MSLALYRKYRPSTFAEVIGQEHVTEPLSNALQSGKVHHAYLFSGPRGCGKTSSARIMARSLNCEKGPTPTPCGECQSCKDLVANGPGSIDVIEIDAATHGLVDDARELRDKAFFAPVNSRYKIYIIDEAHQLGSGAANALLKVVEEPPPHVLFIFATTEPEKLISTIRSRTHHYPFRLVPPGILAAHLEKICNAEGIKVAKGVIPLVVRASGGSVRDALSGRMVLTHIEEVFYKDQPIPPVTEVNPENLEQILRTLEIDPNQIQAGIAFVSKWHDGRVSAEVLANA